MISAPASSSAGHVGAAFEAKIAIFRARVVSPAEAPQEFVRSAVIRVIFGVFAGCLTP
jgi:hypothetical protein